mgnify:CR=1 FL=1
MPRATVVAARAARETVPVARGARAEEATAAAGSAEYPSPDVKVIRHAEKMRDGGGSTGEYSRAAVVNVAVG